MESKPSLQWMNSNLVRRTGKGARKIGGHRGIPVER